MSGLLQSERTWIHQVVRIDVVLDGLQQEMSAKGIDIGEAAEPVAEELPVEAVEVVAETQA